MEPPRPARVRQALRAVHATQPEAAATLESYLDDVEERVGQLRAEDPYRALVLDLHETMVRVDSGLLADVARIEAGRVETTRLAAERDAKRPSVVAALTTPQALAVLLPLLLGSGGIGGLIVRYILTGAP